MVMYCDICGAKIENGDKVTECPDCLCPFENVDKTSPIKEYKSKIPHGGIIKKISTDESFMDAMIKLYETDPIEYQLKIQQFKTQLKQQEQSDAIRKQERESNRPHCPTCGSTNIKRITGTERAVSVIGLGMFSKKINKSYKCLNCKTTW
ncbi:MAG: hypothetical protein J6C32_06055 [Eubacterium sp.]|nr:hypothetical protein [Eubacterium sp.]